MRGKKLTARERQAILAAYLRDDTRVADIAKGSGFSRGAIWRVVRAAVAAGAAEYRKKRGASICDDGLCGDCGLSHGKRDRLARLKRMLPADASEVLAAYPCTYSVRGKKGDSRLLYRDLHALGATRAGGRLSYWSLEKP